MYTLSRTIRDQRRLLDSRATGELAIENQTLRCVTAAVITLFTAAAIASQAPPLPARTAWSSPRSIWRRRSASMC